MAEKEYIERGVAIEFVKRYSPTVDGFTTLQCVENAIKEIPAADVVEVVRRKDCKHATFYACKNDACYRGIICEYRIGTDDENFFCTYGERKEQK